MVYDIILNDYIIISKFVINLKNGLTNQHLMGKLGICMGVL